MSDKHSKPTNYSQLLNQAMKRPVGAQWVMVGTATGLLLGVAITAAAVAPDRTGPARSDLAAPDKVARYEPAKTKADPVPTVTKTNTVTRTVTVTQVPEACRNLPAEVENLYNYSVTISGAANELASKYTLAFAHLAAGEQVQVTGDVVKMSAANNKLSDAAASIVPEQEQVMKKIKECAGKK